jgi:exosortase
MFRKTTYWDWAVLIVPSLCLLALLNLQMIFLLEKEHMQFFPLAFAAVGYFFYMEGKSDAMCLTGRIRTWFAVLMAVFAIILGAFSLFIMSPFVAQLTFVLCIFAWAVGRFGNLSFLRVVGICGLIVVTIPPPFGLDKSMVTGLQSLSSTICSQLIDVTGILQLQRGNVIEITSKPLFVEEACSGVDSQYALMAVAGTLLLLARTGFVVSAITIITVPIWAILGNLLRIYSIVLGLEFLNLDLSEGTKHTILGLCSFSVAAYAHWSNVQFLNYVQDRFFAKNTTALTIAESPSVQTSSMASADESIGLSRLNSRLLLVMLIPMVLCLPMGILGWYNHFLIKLPTISQAIADRMPGEKDLPRTFESAVRVHYATSSRSERNALGQHSHSWNYSSPVAPSTISFDFPFRGFHPLWECYTNSGWTRTAVNEIQAELNGEPTEWRFFEVLFTNKEGEYGCLHFCFFDENANVYNYDGEVDVTQPNRLAVNFWDAVRKPIRDLDSPLLFQVQAFCSSQYPISEEQKAMQQRLFRMARVQLMEKTIQTFQLSK